METNETLRNLLSKNQALVKSFGKPYYLQYDEDTYSEWWEFVAFDGTRWQPFQLDERFRISSEPYLDVNDKGSRPSDFIEQVCAEFSKAAIMSSG